jgi:hypothetical protein
MKSNLPSCREVLFESIYISAELESCLVLRAVPSNGRYVGYRGSCCASDSVRCGMSAFIDLIVSVDKIF